MYFCRKRSPLFILVLAQIVFALGETEVEECPAQTSVGEWANEQEEATSIDPLAAGAKEEVKEGGEPALNYIAANTSPPKSTKVNCVLSASRIFLKHLVHEFVEIVNATRLTQLLVSEAEPANRSKSEQEERQIPAKCILVLFYAKWCAFSSQVAPLYHAMPNLFPDIKAVAIDVIQHQSFIAQYGIVGVPTLMLVHNGKPVAKFNDTVYDLFFFKKFVMRYTNLQPRGLPYINEYHFVGPLSDKPSDDMDYCLVLSWAFIAICALYFTSKSRWWQQFVELVQNTWRESNAQHEHAE